MQGFNRYLDISNRYLKGLDAERLGRKRKRGSRNVIDLEEFGYLRGFGPGIRNVIEPESSDEESETQHSFPSVHKVTQKIIDTSSLVLNEAYSDTQHNPCLLISPVPSCKNELQMLKLLKSLHIRVHSCQLVDLNSALGKSAFLWFQSESFAQAAFTKLTDRDVHSNEVLGNLSNIKWVDYKIYYKEIPFYAVIVRGFSNSLKPSDLNRFFPVHFTRCEIRVIDGVACGVFVFGSVAEACEMCLKMNGAKDSCGCVLKTHLHPLTQQKHGKGILDVLRSGNENTEYKTSGKNGGGIEIYEQTPVCLKNLSRHQLK